MASISAVSTPRPQHLWRFVISSSSLGSGFVCGIFCTSEKLIWIRNPIIAEVKNGLEERADFLENLVAKHVVKVKRTVSDVYFFDNFVPDKRIIRAVDKPWDISLCQQMRENARGAAPPGAVRNRL